MRVRYVPLAEDAQMSNVLHIGLFGGVDEGLALREHCNGIASQQEGAIHSCQSEGEGTRIVRSNLTASLPYLRNSSTASSRREHRRSWASLFRSRCLKTNLSIWPVEPRTRTDGFFDETLIMDVGWSLVKCCISFPGELAGYPYVRAVTTRYLPKHCGRCLPSIRATTIQSVPCVLTKLPNETHYALISYHTHNTNIRTAFRRRSDIVTADETLISGLFKNMDTTVQLLPKTLLLEDR